MFASIKCAFAEILGKENVCKPCARKVAVQTLCKQNSPRNLCKLVQIFWPAVARGWPVARPDHRREGQDSLRGLTLACGQRRRLTQYSQQTLRVNRMHRREI